MFVPFFFIMFICLMSPIHYNFKVANNITNIEFVKLNKDYNIKEDIINYNRFQYVYKIKGHPLHKVTNDILHFLKKKYSFYLVTNKCPLYFKKHCFQNILIKNENITTSIKNNFFFSNSYLYLPQATSLFPTALERLTDYLNGKQANTTNITNNNNGTTAVISTAAAVNDKETKQDKPTEKQTTKQTERQRKKQTERQRKKQTEKQTKKQTELTQNENFNERNFSFFPEKIRNSLQKEESDYFYCSNAPNMCILSSVYRKDNIDKWHFPFFTQMDIYIKIENELITNKKNLLYFLCQFLSFLFQKKFQWRIKKDFFDFTEESLQAEVFFNDKWVEILGAGIIKHKIIFKKKKIYGSIIQNYMALGLGLERITMILHKINRIRNLFLYTSLKEHTNTTPTVTTTTTQTLSTTQGQKEPKKRKQKQKQKQKQKKKQNVQKKEEEEEEEKEKKNNQQEENNILTDSPQEEGRELKEDILSFIINKGEQIKKPFLHFHNLFNVKNEERDFSFYINKEWNNEEFIKNIYNNIKDLNNNQYLKNIILFDVFFNHQTKKTSNTYRFVYVANNHIHNQQYFKECVKQLHEKIIQKICSLYEITVR